MIFKRLVLLIAALAVAVLSGCGNGSQAGESQDDAIPQYTLPPIAKEAKPASGGELSFPVPQKFLLNPLKTKNFEVYNLFTLIYESPIRIGVDGHPQPELVETWEVDDTGLEWTFNVRQGVQWHGGNGELTAEDIVYTIDQIRTYTVADSNYAYHNNKIQSCSAVDTYTVKITLTEPGNTAIYYMTFPVLSKAYLESKDADTAKPIGTGPYQVDSIDVTDQVALSANENWWKQQPYIPNLTALCYPDHDTELVAFKQNLFDFVTTSSLTVDTYQKYGETVYVDYLTQYYDCLVPNTSGLFGDVNLRQAVAYALDKRDIVSKALLGHAVAADYPVAPDSYLSASSSKIYEYNPQKALELLEQSGWKQLDDDILVERIIDNQIQELSFELLFDAKETYRNDVAENIATQLRLCGMDVKIVGLESSEFANRIQQGNFEMALCSFYMDINPDISALVGTAGAINYGRFSDIELDGLLQNCRMALDEETMKQAYIQMEDRFLTLMPQIGLYYRTNALLYRAKVNISTNLRDRNLLHTLPHWYLYVDESEF